MVVDCKILNTAREFYKVGIQLYKDISIEVNGKNWVKLIPTIVNLSFAAELYLKSMLNGERGHDLNHLFNGLSKEEKETIIDMTIINYQNMSGQQIDSETFGELLKKAKDAFYNWRYFYEMSIIDIDLFFLISFLKSLQALSSIYSFKEDNMKE